MSSIDSIQLPLLIDPKKKRYIRSQFGALCYRFKNDQIEFLLITSRRTKRWILPKGWPENHMTPGESAANEAFEEAGALDKLEAFASFNGADFYDLPRNTDTITLVRDTWQLPATIPFEDSQLVPLGAGTTLNWKLSL